MKEEKQGFLMKQVSDDPVSVEVMEKGAGKSVFEVDSTKVKADKIQSLIGFNVKLQLEFDKVIAMEKA